MSTREVTDFGIYPFTLFTTMDGKEQEIRQQFLEEAQEYLDTLDASLLGLADGRVDIQKINAALRSAHSIKGGAGMMGFTTLSEIAHRLEDFFKVLKVQGANLAIDADLEHLLLSSVEGLRQIVHLQQRGDAIDAEWLAVVIDPVIEALHQRLGDPQAEDAASLLATEDGQSIIPLLFETEVEGCLERLESVLADPAHPCLREEVEILAQELGGLGEMLQLGAFSALCESVTIAIAENSDNILTIAQSALHTWRHSQALVLTGQMDQLPTTIALAPSQPSLGVAAPVQSDGWLPKQVARDLNGSAVDDAVSDRTPPLPDTPISVEAPVTAIEPEWWMPEPVAEPTQRVSAVNTGWTESTQSPVEPDEVNEAATVRVPVRQLNQLNDLFGELAIERNGLDIYLKRLRTLAQSLGDRVKALESVNGQLRTAYDRGSFGSMTGDREQFDSLELDRFSDLHLLSQQIIETIVQVQEVSTDIDISLDDTEQTARDLNKTAKQLQTNLTQLRMRPLSDVLDRFPKALRELCLQHNKKVKLVVKQGNTLIDRNILEALHDPLMHLLRNAFDHGIEAPDRRLKVGKSEEGLIEIAATHRNNRTVITMRDDGGGIPLEKVRDRAASMGLDAALLATASEEDLLSLIFEPGFSTSDHVTALSGRGVGMDVVRDNLRQIRGDVKVATKTGVGTTFTLSVPMTLSVVRVLLAESHGLLLAFPTDVVEEIFLLQPETVTKSVGSEVIPWQGQVAQLVRLGQWLQFNCPREPQPLETPPTINAAAILMVRRNQDPIALQVDRCWGEQEVAIRRVESPIPMPEGFSNCTILGDGRVVPLVSVADLLHWITSCERSHMPRGLASGYRDEYADRAIAAVPRWATLEPVASQSANTTVLVVDDSINVRRFLALTLERAGYRVEQAKDGQDAIERLETGLAVQAVICDIEMPRLDGYGLLTKLKANPKLEQIPVAMLTSRSGNKHRQLAVNLGASAYFSKPYNEQDLLRTLKQLVTA